MRTGRLIAGVAMLMALMQGAMAQGLALGTSDPQIAIHSTFAGETITLFGNIEPGADGAPVTGTFDVVMVVSGPPETRVVRRKDRQYGLVLNADHALFMALPSFYRVLSSRPLEAILNPEAIAEWRLTPDDQAALALSTGDAGLEGELVRLMTANALFGQDEDGVAFLSPTLFSGRIGLPAHVPNGVYRAQILVVRDGEIIVAGAQSFSIEKAGFEDFVARSAVEHPLPYGLFTVLLALATGWMGGVLFRR